MKLSNVILFAGGSAALVNHQGCLQWCTTNFGILGLATCYAPSFYGKGPCFDCGPHKSIPTRELCQKKCVDLNTDKYNCGKCGNKCPTGATCHTGSCLCTNSNKPPCHGQCPELSSDNNNCGACGHVCPSGSTCKSSSCLCSNSGKPPCSDGSCPDLSSDNNNCGQCGNKCASGKCENGACSAPACAGMTCDTFETCGPGGSCVCASTVSGSGFCVDGTTPCAILADCQSQSDCPIGQVCAVQTCCSRNVCVGAETCGSDVLKRHFVRARDEATIGHRGS